MLWNVLSSSPDSNGNSGGMFIMLGFLVVILVVFMISNRRSQRKKQEEMQNTLDAIKPEYDDLAEIAEKQGISLRELRKTLL